MISEKKRSLENKERLQTDEFRAQGEHSRIGVIFHKPPGISRSVHVTVSFRSKRAFISFLFLEARCEYGPNLIFTIKCDVSFPGFNASSTT